MKFPKGFLFGSATAGHQIEGGDFGSDWYEWEKLPGKIADGSTAEIAADSWNQWKKDIELLKKTNQNAYRFSIEWSRIEPAEGKIDREAVAHYREILSELKKNNIKSMVTIFHFVLPKWISEIGGFDNLKTIKYFINYVEILGKEFGDLVDYWVTINEPQTYILNSYVWGTWPPGQKNVFRALKLGRKLNKAHVLAYKKMRSLTSAPVGISQNIAIFEPLADRKIDKRFTRYVNNIANISFIAPISKYIDFLGINYYYNVKVQRQEPQFLFHLKTKNDIGWNIYQEGLYQVIMQNQIWRKPIFITENGVADGKDQYRPQFLKDAFLFMHKAIRKGADVRGYFHWSLMDNFEWAHGYNAKFGLFTKDRRPRKSAKIYAELIKNASQNGKDSKK